MVFTNCEYLHIPNWVWSTSHIPRNNRVLREILIEVSFFIKYARNQARNSPSKYHNSTSKFCNSQVESFTDLVIEREYLPLVFRFCFKSFDHGNAISTKAVRSHWGSEKNASRWRTRGVERREFTPLVHIYVVLSTNLLSSSISPSSKSNQKRRHATQWEIASFSTHWVKS